MTLSKREQEILRRLEREFDVKGPASWRLRGLRFKRWSDSIGGIALVIGLALVLILLPSSVWASFAAFAVAMLGLAQLLTGRTASRLVMAMRRARTEARSETEPPDDAASR